MGRHHEDGYSADVEGYFVVGDTRICLAKTNGNTFVIAEPCELPPSTCGQLVVIIDGQKESRTVTLPDGILRGQTQVKYTQDAPF